MRNIPSRTVRALSALGLVMVLASCTPAEIAAWEHHLATRAPETPEQIVRRVFGPDADDAWRVVAGCDGCRCPNGESGGNPSAVSPGGGNHGLFQLNTVHRRSFEQVIGPWSLVYDADANTRFAKWLFDGSGWRPWSCRP